MTPIPGYYGLYFYNSNIRVCVYTLSANDAIERYGLRSGIVTYPIRESIGPRFVRLNATFSRDSTRNFYLPVSICWVTVVTRLKRVFKNGIEPGRIVTLAREEVVCTQTGKANA